MDIETFREYCLSIPHTAEDIKWESSLCFMVAEKIFCMVSLNVPHSLCIKCNPEQFVELTSLPGITQAPYLAKNQWVKLESLEVMAASELKALVLNSRMLIFSKLTKKLQAELT